MSYFNDDQLGHMRSLASIPDKERCWCGWHRIGKCPNCAPDASRADRLAVMCVECKHYPQRPGETITHWIGCSARNTTTESGT